MVLEGKVRGTQDDSDGLSSRCSETFLAEREGGVPRGSSRTLGDGLIELLRPKQHYSNPSAGGWRDIINFMVNLRA